MCSHSGCPLRLAPRQRDRAATAGSGVMPGSLWVGDNANLLLLNNLQNPTLLSQLSAHFMNPVKGRTWKQQLVTLLKKKIDLLGMQDVWLGFEPVFLLMSHGVLGSYARSKARLTEESRALSLATVPRGDSHRGLQGRG